MLLQEHSSCLCRGENGKPFCLAELWPALIVRIHWDFTINAVHSFQNTKKNYFGFTHAPLKFISAPQKDKHFIGQLWQLMTASNVDVWTQVWQAKWAVFKILGFVCKPFFPFSPPPPRSFTCAIFSAVFDSCSSFFAPKPHRNLTLATQAKEKKSEIFLKKESNRMQRWNIVALEGGMTHWTGWTGAEICVSPFFFFPC